MVSPPTLVEKVPAGARRLIAKVLGPDFVWGVSTSSYQIELEPVSDEASEVGATRDNNFHQASHALLAARTERGDDLVVAKPGRKCIEGNAQVRRVDSEAR